MKGFRDRRNQKLQGLMQQKEQAEAVVTSLIRETLQGETLAALGDDDIVIVSFSHSRWLAKEATQGITISPLRVGLMDNCMLAWAGKAPPDGAIVIGVMKKSEIKNYVVAFMATKEAFSGAQAKLRG